MLQGNQVECSTKRIKDGGDGTSLVNVTPQNGDDGGDDQVGQALFNTRFVYHRGVLTQFLPD